MANLIVVGFDSKYEENESLLGKMSRNSSTGDFGNHQDNVLLTIADAEKQNLQREVRELSYQLRELQENAELTRENSKATEVMYLENLQIATQNLEEAQKQNQMLMEQNSEGD